MKGLAELASFHFLEFEWKNSTSRSWAPLRCSLQCVPPPAGVIRVCGGVRGRGLWVTSPGASTLLLVVLLSSFHLRLGGWLPSCSSRSLLPSDARVVFFVRRFRLPAKVTGHQPTLPVHSKSRPCRCFAFAVHPATNVDHPLAPSVSFRSLPFRPRYSPIGNWRKLYAGVRRVKPLECRLTVWSVLTF